MISNKCDMQAIKTSKRKSWQSINLALFLPFVLPRSPCGSLAMTDKGSTLCYFAMTAHHCHFELSIESEKSINLTNLKIQKIQEFRKFKKIKNKNPRI